MDERVVGSWLSLRKTESCIVSSGLKTFKGIAVNGFQSFFSMSCTASLVTSGIEVDVVESYISGYTLVKNNFTMSGKFKK